MAAIMKQNSRAWKWRKASQEKAELRILRKMGSELHMKLSKMLAISKNKCKKSDANAKKPFNYNTMNDGIKLSAQTSFMEKGTEQREEK